MKFSPESKIRKFLFKVRRMRLQQIEILQIEDGGPMIKAANSTLPDEKQLPDWKQLIQVNGLVVSHGQCFLFRGIVDKIE